MKLKRLTDVETRAWCRLITETSQYLSVLENYYLVCTAKFFSNYMKKYSASVFKCFYEKFDSYEDFMDSSLQLWADAGLYGCGYMNDGLMYKPFGLKYSPKELEFMAVWSELKTQKHRVNELLEVWVKRAVHPMEIDSADMSDYWEISKLCSTLRNAVQEYEDISKSDRLDMSDIDSLLHQMIFKNSEVHEV